MHAAVALVAVVVAAPPAAEITTVKLSCAEQGVSRVPNRMSPPKAWRGVSTPLRSSEVKSETTSGMGCVLVTGEQVSVCIAVGVGGTLYMHVMDYERSNIYRGLFHSHALAHLPH